MRGRGSMRALPLAALLAVSLGSLPAQAQVQPPPASAPDNCSSTIGPPHPPGECMRESGATRTLPPAALLAASLGSLPAQAQVQPPPTSAPDLYQDALQSIAEGRKNDAYETLMRVIEKEPLHAGAWLEVALIQCGLGHAEEAERLFATIETRFNPPPGIVELIANARETGCNRWQPFTTSSISFGRGIDQNVNQGASDPVYIFTRPDGTGVGTLLTDFLPKHDQYTVLSTEYLRDLTPNGSVGFVQFQGRHNDRLTDYNSASLFMGVETPWRFGRWTLRGTAMGGMISLGGRLYQRQAQLQARVGPPLPLPGSTQFTLYGGATRTEFLTLTNFDSTTYELRGQLAYRNQNRSAGLSLAFLDDRASLKRPGGDRSGTVASAMLRQSLGQKIGAELGYSRQSWRGTSSYSPGVISEVRSQLTQVLRASLSYPVAKNQSVQLEARLVRDTENISIFQYNNRQLQLSWQWQGP
jgi:hypothetical protein